MSDENEIAAGRAATVRSGAGAEPTATPAGASESDSPLRLMLDQLPAIVWTTDRELRVVSVTGAGLAALAENKLEPGTEIAALGTTALAAHQWALDGEQVVCEVTWDGRTLQMCIDPFRDAGGAITGCLGVGLDITERKKAEEEIQQAHAIDNARLYRQAQEAAAARDQALAEERRARREAEALAADVKVRGDQQAVVAALGQCALAGASVSELMDDAVAYVAQTLDVPQAAVLELVPAKDTGPEAGPTGALQLCTGIGLPADRPDVVIGSGLASHGGYALLTGGPVVADDLATETRFGVAPMPLGGQMVASSGISVPIQAGGRQLGVLAAYSPQRGRFGQDDVHFLQAVAQVLGLAIANQAAEQELRDSQRRFKTLFDVLPVGLSIVDAQRRVVDANPALSRILDLTPEQLARGDFRPRRMIRPDGSPLPADELPSARALCDRQATQAELGVVKENGETVWVRVEAAPFPLPGLGVVIATSGITVQKEAEREREVALNELAKVNAQLEAQTDELRDKAEVLAVQAGELGVQAEQLSVQAAELEVQNRDLALAADAINRERWRYQELFDFAPDAYLVTDMNGTIQEANRAAGGLLGVQPRFLVGKPLAIYIDPADQATWLAGLGDLAHGARARVRLETRVVPRRGANLPVAVEGVVARGSEGVPAGLRWLLHDVSDYKRLEEELRQARDELEQRVEQRTRELAESEMRYRQMFERNWAIKWVLDAETGRIVDANPAACRYYGYELDRLKQMSIGDINVLPAEQINAELRSAVRQERTYFVFKHRLASGEVRDVEVYSSPITVEGRTLLYSIIHDITDRVEAYQLLEQRVAERTRELATLLEIAQRVALTPELEPRLSLILEQLEEVVPYDGATVWGIEGEVIVPLYDRQAGREPQAERGPFPQEQALVGWQIVDGEQPVIVADLLGDEPRARLFREIAGERFQALRGQNRTWLGVPLVVEDRRIGLLALRSAEVGAYDAREAELVAAFGAQAALAMENARLTRRARELAALEERQRLARDLHDAVSQTLFSASLIAEVLPRVWERSPEAGLEALADLHQLTRGALAEMRALLLELRPAALLEVGLGDLLPQLGDVVTGRSRIPVRLDLEEIEALPAEVQINLYRIAQEACSNVAKHSSATHATVTLRGPPAAEGEGPAGIELRIADDGAGFDPNRVAANSLGLDIMRERAAEIGAVLDIDGRPGEGTTITAVWRGGAGQ